MNAESFMTQANQLHRESLQSKLIVPAALSSHALFHHETLKNVHILPST